MVAVMDTVIVTRKLLHSSSSSELLGRWPTSRASSTAAAVELSSSTTDAWMGAKWHGPKPIGVIGS